MDKVLGKVNQTRLNWYNAFKNGVNLKGYGYYKPPAELKYRYPAPGSVAHETNDHPHLYKKHWKTSFRESNYNIQKKEKLITDEENVALFASSTPEFDPNDHFDALVLREQMPQMSGKQVMFDQENMTTEERQNELWAAFEAQPKIMEVIAREYAPYQLDLTDDYDQKHWQFRERGAMAFDSDPILREITLEFEYMIEEVIGYNRIKNKKMKMLKGTPKKWQVLDDKAFDREEVEKMQAAIRAPLPDELEMYQAKHDRPMTLPITNANVSAWRDDARAIDTADFDPQFIEYDRERRKKYFLERYEKPREIAE